MIRAIIPAAGKGTRSGLSTPKTLQLVDGTPILIRILNSLRDIDPEPVVIVSPDGHELIRDVVARHGLRAELIDQPRPGGMGDAVQQFTRSPSFDATDEIVVIWGDMISIPTSLICKVVRRSRLDNADFSFPTYFRNPCYTFVKRDQEGRVRALLERREHSDALPNAGESDCGLFVFKKDPVFRVLTTRTTELIGQSTGEIGFLGVVSLLAEDGNIVHAYEVATEENAISFNSPIDLVQYQKLSLHSMTDRSGTGTRKLKPDKL